MSNADTPKITPKAIEDEIVAEFYFTGHQAARVSLLDEAVEKMQDDDHVIGKVMGIPSSLALSTYCMLTLRNGFTITGHSACAYPETFDEELGRKFAREDAIRQIWPLLGYELRTRLAAQKREKGDLGEALTRMTAHRLGNPKAFRPADAEVILRHFEGSDAEEEGGETHAHVPPTDEQVAEICHELNRAYCQMMGDHSLRPWAETPPEIQATTISGVAFARANPFITPADSHANWLKDKGNAGWKYGPVKDMEKLEHPCFVPYDELPQSQQIKDYLFLSAVRAADNLA
jgi:hypothetical protein